MKKKIAIEYKGLDRSQVTESRKRLGSNVLDERKESRFIAIFKSTVKEPMFILLIVATSVYFALGENSEGIMMLVAISIVTLISFLQDIKTSNALELLKDMSSLLVSVIRDNRMQEVNTKEIVVGDIMLIKEGELISADGELIDADDLAVDESFITGESLAVSKDIEKENRVFRATSIVSGQGLVKVTAVGGQTEIGKLGKSINEISEDQTPLQKQVNNFVKYMAIAGAVAFVIITAFSYYQSRIFLDSLLKGLTIIMSVLPEEIPVALSVFMALGAWRMSRERILAKQPQTVEALGAATVICVDKTGTITENRMHVNTVYSYINNTTETESFTDPEIVKALAYAMWSSEPSPFDPMEVAIHDAYKDSADVDERCNFRMIEEYPLEGKPPMMTHIYENEKKEKIIAAKGAPETIMNASGITDPEKEKIETIVKSYASKGLRILGVAKAEYTGAKFPESQKDFEWKFLGLVCLNDPPRKNITSVIKEFNEAGIKVKMITGDYTETAVNIACQIGMDNKCDAISGAEVMAMSEVELREKVNDCSVFARVHPEGKLKIINALKANGEIVVMTGDGVNDGPALKSADIGVAMGKRGTEIARHAATIVLLDDDLSKMLTGISFGRKTYLNLKKAIQYIISIHIPIIGIVLFPLILGWKFSSIFEPLHVIFLELVMGPTCSIVYEREPMEENLMLKKPRKSTTTFLSWKELRICLLQGLFILAGLMFVLNNSISNGNSAALSRTLVFITLVSSNVFLTLSNRSREYTLLKTLRYKNPLMPIIIGVTILILALILMIPFLQQLFHFQSIYLSGLVLPVSVAFISVFWFEIFKGMRYGKQLKTKN